MDYAAPYPGNFIPSILNLTGKLEKKNIKVILLFPESARSIPWVQNLIEQNFNVNFISNSFLQKKIKASHLSSFKSLLKKEKIGIVHTHFVAVNYNIFLIRRILYRKVKFFGNFMNHFNPPKNRWRKMKIFVLKKSFDFIVGSSESVKNGLIELGYSAKQVSSIQNSLELNHLDTYEKIKLSAKANKKNILMF